MVRTQLRYPKDMTDPIWRCFGDYRDRVLLDLEKRIYNNIKINYDENIDLKDFVDSKFNRKQHIKDTLLLT